MKFCFDFFQQAEFSNFSRRFYIIQEPDNYSHSFLVGAFLEKRVDYSHGYSSGFF